MKTSSSGNVSRDAELSLTRTRIETKVLAEQLNLGVPFIDGPFLGSTAVTIEAVAKPM